MKAKEIKIPTVTPCCKGASYVKKMLLIALLLLCHCWTSPSDGKYGYSLAGDSPSTMLLRISAGPSHGQWSGCIYDRLILIPLYSRSRGQESREKREAYVDY